MSRRRHRGSPSPTTHLTKRHKPLSEEKRGQKLHRPITPHAVQVSQWVQNWIGGLAPLVYAYLYHQCTSYVTGEGDQTFDALVLSSFDGSLFAYHQEEDQWFVVHDTEDGSGIRGQWFVVHHQVHKILSSHVTVCDPMGESQVSALSANGRWQVWEQKVGQLGLLRRCSGRCETRYIHMEPLLTRILESPRCMLACRNGHFIRGDWGTIQELAMDSDEADRYIFIMMLCTDWTLRCLIYEPGTHSLRAVQIWPFVPLKPLDHVKITVSIHDWTCAILSQKPVPNRTPMMQTTIETWKLDSDPTDNCLCFQQKSEDRNGSQE